MTQDNWNKAREQRDKLLEHYNSIIKPTLLEFYELTQQDFKIEIPETEDGQLKPYIKYTKGIWISYYAYDTDTEPTYWLVLRPTVNTLTDKTIDVSNNMDIRMVMMLVRYWSMIRAHLDTTIDSIVLEYSSLLTDKEEETNK